MLLPGSDQILPPVAGHSHPETGFAVLNSWLQSRPTPHGNAFLNAEAMGRSHLIRNGAARESQLDSTR